MPAIVVINTGKKVFTYTIKDRLLFGLLHWLNKFGVKSKERKCV